jgi:uncharacterized protein YqgC (DUF456 family)
MTVFYGFITTTVLWSLTVPLYCTYVLRSTSFRQGVRRSLLPFITGFLLLIAAIILYVKGVDAAGGLAISLMVSHLVFILVGFRKDIVLHFWNLRKQTEPD